MLVIYVFHICKFAHLLNFIHDPQVHTHGALRAIHGHAQSGKPLSHLMHTSPADAKQRLYGLVSALRL